MYVDRSTNKKNKKILVVCHVSMSHITTTNSHRPCSRTLSHYTLCTMHTTLWTRHPQKKYINCSDPSTTFNFFFFFCDKLFDQNSPVHAVPGPAGGDKQRPLAMQFISKVLFCWAVSFPLYKV